MHIQSNSTNQVRARSLVRDIDEEATFAAERARSQGRSKLSESDSIVDSHLLATFRSSEKLTLSLDPQTNEVRDFLKQNRWSRSSGWVGGATDFQRQTLRQEGSTRVYAKTERKFNEEECISRTETVKVTADGQLHYASKDHLDGKLENFFRCNPSTRRVTGQALGGALGGLVGTLVTAHTGMPLEMAVGAGACVGATIGGTAADKQTSYGRFDGLLETCAYLPSKLIEIAGGLGTVGVLFSLFLISQG